MTRIRACDDLAVDEARRVAFEERLVPRWPAWLVTIALIAMIAGAYGAALGAVVGWTLGIGLGLLALVATLTLSPRIIVTSDALRAGVASLPRSQIGQVTPLNAEETRQARGPRADARSFVLLRTLHAATAVRVELRDPEDPHPCWLLTTARPHELAQALSSVTTDGAR